MSTLKISTLVLGFGLIANGFANNTLVKDLEVTCHFLEQGNTDVLDKSQTFTLDYDNDYDSQSDSLVKEVSSLINKSFKIRVSASKSKAESNITRIDIRIYNSKISQDMPLATTIGYSGIFGVSASHMTFDAGEIERNYFVSCNDRD
jgi:hypothetical protein